MLDLIIVNATSDKTLLMSIKSINQYEDNHYSKTNTEKHTKVILKPFHILLSHHPHPLMDQSRKNVSTSPRGSSYLEKNMT